MRYNRRDGYLHVNGDADGTAGITTANRRIYIADAVRNFGEPNFLELNIGHELIHSYQRMTFGSSYNASYSENAVYQYSIDFSRRYGYQSSTIRFYQRQQTNYIQSEIYNNRRISGF